MTATKTQERGEVEKGDEAKTELAISSQPREKLTFDQALAIVQKHLPAKKLTDNDLREVRRALRDQPDLWRAAGDLAVQAEHQLIDRVIHQPAAKEALRLRIDDMRKDLSYDKAPLVERLLMDQIVICWISLNHIQLRYDETTAGSISFALADYWEKRLTISQGRFYRAIETLAKVRKLSRGIPLQVNIGGQQINLAKTKE